MGKLLSLSLNDDLYYSLVCLSDEECRTLSAQVRLILKDYIDDYNLKMSRKIVYIGDYKK